MDPQLREFYQRLIYAHLERAVSSMDAQDLIETLLDEARPLEVGDTRITIALEWALTRPGSLSRSQVSEQMDRLLESAAAASDRIPWFRLAARLEQGNRELHDAVCEWAATLQPGDMAAMMDFFRYFHVENNLVLHADRTPNEVIEVLEASGSPDGLYLALRIQMAQSRADFVRLSRRLLSEEAGKIGAQDFERLLCSYIATGREAVIPALPALLRLRSLNLANLESCLSGELTELSREAVASLVERGKVLWSRDEMKLVIR